MRDADLADLTRPRARRGQVAAEYQARGDSRPHGHVQAVGDAHAPAGLGEGPRAHVVPEGDGAPAQVGYKVTQGRATPAEVGGEDAHASFLVDDPRHAHSQGSPRAGECQEGLRHGRDHPGDVLGPGVRGRCRIDALAHNPVIAGENRLDGGSADVDSDSQRVHGRMTDRVRLRGVSGLRPRASARSTARRWARTR